MIRSRNEIKFTLGLRNNYHEITFRAEEHIYLLISLCLDNINYELLVSTLSTELVEFWCLDQRLGIQHNQRHG